PSLVQDEVDPLDADEARAVLAAATDRRNAARWSVALAIGLRQGEALGLQWPDVDLDAGTVSVRQALQRRRWQHGCGSEPCGRRRAAECPARHGGGLVLTEVKSKAARRSIALPAGL